jgi:hypothetical protein
VVTDDHLVQHVAAALWRADHPAWPEGWDNARAGNAPWVIVSYERRAQAAIAAVREATHEAAR